MAGVWFEYGQHMADGHLPRDGEFGMTFEEIAALIQRGLDQHPQDKSLKFDCGDDGVLTIAGGKAVLADAPTDCTIRLSKRTLDKVIAGEMNPMTGFALGKIKVSGDMSVALKLSQLLKSA
jgi:putative sterol carrier protein